MPSRNYYQASTERKPTRKEVPSQKIGDSSKLEITVPAKLLDGTDIIDHPMRDTEENVKKSAPSMSPFPRHLTLGGAPLGVRGPLFERRWVDYKQPRMGRRNKKTL
ncbi:MAG: hypothetical protein ACFFD4_29595 [Candidatus Odinarchaeota archaeon]